MTKEDTPLAVVSGALLLSGLADLFSGHWIFGVAMAAVAVWGGKRIL